MITSKHNAGVFRSDRRAENKSKNEFYILIERIRMNFFTEE